jgi:hypothetical protein
MENNLGKDVLEKIKEEKIKPRPKWMFSLKDIGFWVMFSISLILGSISTSLIIFILRNNDWDLYSRLGHGTLEFIFITLPYFWLIFLAFFLITSYYNLKKTKSGYKHNPLSIVSINILISIILGSTLYICGLGSELEESLEETVPPYSKMFYQRHEMWNKPEKGLIGGRIIVFENNNKFKIISLGQKEWDILSKDPIIHPRFILQEGGRVKIIGREVGSSIFEAEEIRPFIEKQIFFERNKFEMPY